MKIKKGIKIEVIKEKGEDRSNYTRYWVRGEGCNLYMITVDSENLWTCTCESNIFRGLCYHILMIKTELERRILTKRMHKINPVCVNRRDFDNYFNSERFIAEPIYGGPRQFVIFGRFIYRGGKKEMEWCLPGHIKLAGTILEGLWDCYGKKRGMEIFRICDCLFYKGLDYRFSPLAIRREMAERVIKVWRPPMVRLTDYEYSLEGKNELMNQWGSVLLKDINSTYDLTEKSPRAWMVLMR